MLALRALALAWLTSSVLLVPLRASFAAETATGPIVTIDDISSGIEKHIAEQSKTNGGYVRLQYNQKELSLT